MGHDNRDFKPLFEHANDAIALVSFRDDTPIIEDANDVFRELFGSDEADIIGADLDEIVTSEKQIEQARQISRNAREGQVVTRELTRQTVDGPRDFYWQLIPVEDPKSDSIDQEFAMYTDITERVQQRERFQAFIEESTDIVTVLDPDGTYQYQSPSSERIVGYKPSELIGRNAFDFVHPEDKQRVMETFYEAVENPSQKPKVEYRFQHQDGNWVWLESRGNNQLDNPAIEGFVVNSRNITDRKEREQELETVRDRMEFALNATDAIVWDWNVDEDEASFYPSEQDLYGTDVESWDDFIDLVHPDDRVTVRESIEESLETGEPKHEEIRILRDGKVRWLEAPGQPVEETDGTTRMIGVAREVTDRVESERQLKESEERYRRLLATAPTPIFVYSNDIELIYTNEAAVEFLGADDREEILGSTAGDFTHPDSKVDVEGRTRQLVEDREAVPPIEEKLIDMNGQVKFAIVAAAPVQYEGEPAVQAVATDVTELKEHEQELERQNERLEEFAGVVSHDLRNPLNVAEGRLDLYRQDGNSDHLEAVDRALDRMAQLINDVLTLAQAGEAIGELEAVELRSLVKSCWRNVETDPAEVVIDTDATIWSDRTRLQQLIENLLRNSVEHSEGDVTVTVGDLPGGFFVEDDGPGISDEVRSNALEPGYSTSQEGTGFGLSIVRDIAEAHGWSIDIASSEEGGARFEITGVEFVD